MVYKCYTFPTEFYKFYIQTIDCQYITNKLILLYPPSNPGFNIRVLLCGTSQRLPKPHNILVLGYYVLAGISLINRAKKSECIDTKLLNIPYNQIYYHQNKRGV
jgi:hypothetical protein